MGSHGDISRYSWSMSPDNHDMDVSENEPQNGIFLWGEDDDPSNSRGLFSDQPK
jgi:hypothetical protein